MSGNKTFTVVTTEVSVAAATAKAFQAYQERRQREQAAAMQREAQIQQRIAQIRAGAHRSRVIVQLPPVTQTLTDTLAKDTQKHLDDLKSRLPRITAEYQTLVLQKLLSAQTVQQVIARTEQALKAQNLAAAEAHLQALDDARIQAIQQLQTAWAGQIEYLQERLEALYPRLPQTVITDWQNRITRYRTHYPLLTDANLQQLHFWLSDLEAQAEQVRETANNLVNSWLEVGYAARIIGMDDGDVVIEVETHEGMNTQMRVQFNSQQIDLFGPPEEITSCQERTIAALQIFQEQGYHLEWTGWDGQPVLEEWRHLYSPTPQQQLAPQQSSLRQQQMQGY